MPAAGAPVLSRASFGTMPSSKCRWRAGEAHSPCAGGFGSGPTTGLSLRCGAARARWGTGCARRGARRGGAGRRSRGLRHRRAGDRQDLARHPVRAAISTPGRGCCSAPATTSRSRGRWARFETSSATVSPRSEEALAAGAAPHEIQSLLIAELELPPQPTVLVLEDVHWADDATLDVDHRARAADRLAAGAARAHLPRRRGAAGHPLRAAARRDPRRRLGVPRARAAVGERRRLARRRRRGRRVRRDRRQPVLRHRAARLAGRRRAAAVGRERRARARVAARRRARGASSSSSRSCRTASARRCWTR